MKDEIKVGDYVDYVIRAKVTAINPPGSRFPKYELDVPSISRYIYVDDDEITKSRRVCKPPTKEREDTTLDDPTSINGNENVIEQ